MAASFALWLNADFLASCFDWNKVKWVADIFWISFTSEKRFYQIDFVFCFFWNNEMNFVRIEFFYPYKDRK